MSLSGCGWQVPGLKPRLPFIPQHGRSPRRPFSVTATTHVNTTSRGTPSQTNVTFGQRGRDPADSVGNRLQSQTAGRRRLLSQPCRSQNLVHPTGLTGHHGTRQNTTGFRSSRLRSRCGGLNRQKSIPTVRAFSRLRCCRISGRSRRSCSVWNRREGRVRLHRIQILDLGNRRLVRHACLGAERSNLFGGSTTGIEVIRGTCRSRPTRGGRSIKRGIRSRRSRGRHGILWSRCAASPPWSRRVRIVSSAATLKVGVHLRLQAAARLSTAGTRTSPVRTRTTTARIATRITAGRNTAVRSKRGITHRITQTPRRTISRTVNRIRWCRIPGTITRVVSIGTHAPRPPPAGLSRCCTNRPGCRRQYQCRQTFHLDDSPRHQVEHDLTQTIHCQQSAAMQPPARRRWTGIIRRDVRFRTRPRRKKRNNLRNAESARQTPDLPRLPLRCQHSRPGIRAVCGRWSVLGGLQRTGQASRPGMGSAAVNL